MAGSKSRKGTPSKTSGGNLKITFLKRKETHLPSTSILGFQPLVFGGVTFSIESPGQFKKDHHQNGGSGMQHYCSQNTFNNSSLEINL